MSAADVTELLAGRYRLDQRVASGGFGEVWRATDTVLQRPVAVKLLRAEISADPQALARFRDEACHAGGLAHDNITRVYDYGEPGPGHPAFLVMEFVDGASLAEMLAGGPLAPARAMDVVAQCAAGLAAAHQAGLAHRGLTPANILISNDSLAKLTGFGSSRADAAAPAATTGTLQDVAVYRAPERLHGDPGTAAGDLYSLGVVAYQCLAGVALAHRRRPLPPSVLAEAAALVAHLTADNPRARPGASGRTGAQRDQGGRDRSAGAGARGRARLRRHRGPGRPRRRPSGPGSSHPRGASAAAATSDGRSQPHNQPGPDQQPAPHRQPAATSAGGATTGAPGTAAITMIANTPAVPCLMAAAPVTRRRLGIGRAVAVAFAKEGARRRHCLPVVGAEFAAGRCLQFAMFVPCPGSGRSWGSSQKAPGLTPPLSAWGSGMPRLRKEWDRPIAL